MALATIPILAIPASAQENRIIVPVTINEVPKGEMLIALRGDDIHIRVSDLQQAGMSGAMWNRIVNLSRLSARMQLQGDETISLRLFEPLLRYKFDEAALTLSMTVDARLFGQTAFDLQVRRPADLQYSKAISTFLNYAVSSRGVSDLGFSGETGTSIGGNLIYNSFFRPAGGKLLRSLSQFIVDDTTRLRRWTFGDAIASTDTLGGSAALGGMTLSRNFNLDPYFLRYPSYGLAGTATTPSTVDVYVNGVLVQRSEVPPGPFDLRNIPVSAGSGTARVVIRDAYGNEHVQTQSFYYSTAVLGRGTSEFSYSVGALRRNFSTSSFDYGDPAILGFHRYGLTDTLTLGGRFETTRGLVSGGGGASMRTRIGDVEATAAVSSHDGENGTAGGATYRYLGRRVSFGGTLRTFSRTYANLNTIQEPADLRILRDGNAFMSLLIPRGSFTIQWNSVRFPNQPVNDHIALLTSVSVSRATFYLSVGQANQGGRRHADYFAGIGVYGAHMTTANVSVSGGNGRPQQTVEIQRPLPVGTGFGYRLFSTTGGGNKTGNAVLQYNAPFGQYDVGLDPYHTSSKPTINASGGFVYEKGAFQFTRAIQDSFALVRVPGVPNVRVYLSNQLVGRTDANGDLLVPNMLSYYGNTVRIDDRDIPLDYDVRQIQETIAPTFRGGAFVEFPIQRVRTIAGSVVVKTSAGDVVPAFGELTVNDDRLRSYTSPLGRQGELYLENIPPGTFTATVEFSGGECAVTIVIPPTSGNIVKLGILPCTPTRKTP
ncbi:MAG: fimbria/pilus outer membrane usher protein [Acidobacteriota bacterium]|nr:fimbria/pilus outer membrane usher protein [Acidobacteriota bacterium]